MEPGESSYRIGQHGVQAVHRGELLRQLVGCPAVIRLQARAGAQEAHRHSNATGYKQASNQAIKVRETRPSARHRVSFMFKRSKGIRGGENSARV